MSENFLNGQTPTSALQWVRISNRRPAGGMSVTRSLQPEQAPVRAFIEFDLWQPLWCEADRTLPYSDVRNRCGWPDHGRCGHSVWPRWPVLSRGVYDESVGGSVDRNLR